MEKLNMSKYSMYLNKKSYKENNFVVIADNENKGHEVYTLSYCEDSIDFCCNDSQSVLLLDFYEKLFDSNIILLDNWNFFTILFNLSESELTVEKKKFDNAFKNYGKYDYYFSEENNEVTLNVERIEKLKSILNIRNKKYQDEIYIYTTTNKKSLLIDFIAFFFKFHSNKVIRRCENCQKWFIPNNKVDTKYCNRISPQYSDKTCKEAMILIKKIQNEKSDETKRFEKKIYNKLRTAYKNYEKESDKLKLEIFMKTKEEMKQKLKNSVITEKEYQEWLLSHYVREEKQNGII